MQSFKQFFKEAIENNTPSVLYHVTKASNVDSILKNGLEPRLVKTPGLKTRTPRIYLFSSINSENIDMIELLQHEIKSMGGFMAPRITTPPKQYEDVAVFKVTIPKGIKLYRDPLINITATNAYFIANKTIDPHNLELVYTGPIKGKSDKSLKSFVKSYGIEGDPYRVYIVLDENKIEQFKSKLAELKEQAGNKLIPNKDIKIIDRQAKTLTILSLQSLKDVEFWRNRLEQFDHDRLFNSPHMQLYSEAGGDITVEVWSKKVPNLSYHYSLGMDRMKLVDVLVKEFGVKVATSEGELQEIYNKMVTELGHPELTYK